MRRAEGGVEVGGDGRREGWRWEETGGRRGEGSVLLCESTAMSVVASTLVSPHLCSPQLEVSECC